MVLLDAKNKLPQKITLDDKCLSENFSLAITRKLFQTGIFL